MGHRISTQPDDWDLWWKNLTQIGLRIVQVESASREAPSAINNAIKELDARRRLTERQLQALGAIQADIRGLANQDCQTFKHSARTSQNCGKRSKI